MKKALEKVKEFFKKNIIGMMIGAALVGGITLVNADYSFTATKVYYDKNTSLTTKTNVKAALDELYSRAVYGNATAAQILKNRTALVGGKEVTGTMPDNGAISGTVSPGGSYTVASGYHNGSGKVTCNSCPAWSCASGYYCELSSSPTKYYHYTLNNQSISYAKYGFTEETTFDGKTWMRLSREMKDASDKYTRFYYKVSSLAGKSTYFLSINLHGNNTDKDDFALGTADAKHAYSEYLECSGYGGSESNVKSSYKASKAGYAGSVVTPTCGIDSDGTIWMEVKSMKVNTDGTTYSWYTNSNSFTFTADIFYK